MVPPGGWAPAAAGEVDGGCGERPHYRPRAEGAAGTAAAVANADDGGGGGGAAVADADGSGGGGDGKGGGRRDHGRWGV